MQAYSLFVEQKVPNKPTKSAIPLGGAQSPVLNLLEGRVTGVAGRSNPVGKRGAEVVEDPGFSTNVGRRRTGDGIELLAQRNQDSNKIRLPTFASRPIGCQHGVGRHHAFVVPGEEDQHFEFC